MGKAVTLTLLVLLALPGMSAGAQADGLPRGVIVMWSGDLDTIPSGWALCDGSNGTPDLRNRFVLGVGAPEYLGSTGGSHQHRHPAREHSHPVDPPATRLRSVPGYGRYDGYGTAAARGRYYLFPGQSFDPRPFNSGTAAAAQESAAHLPPYYKLAFIMKL
jgi:hypothetical protein